MIGIIPVIVVGGVVKQFSSAFLGKPTKIRQGKGKAKRARYPVSKYRPF